MDLFKTFDLRSPRIGKLSDSEIDHSLNYSINAKGSMTPPLLKRKTDAARPKLTLMAETDDSEKSDRHETCLLYTSPSPRDLSTSRMPSSA